VASGSQSFRTGGLHEAVDSQEPILSKRRALVGEATALSRERLDRECIVCNPEATWDR